MKRILVTGGAGFVGSHLCKKLLEYGNEVICLDNMFTGNKENIKNFLDFKNFEFIRHDVTEPILIEVDEIYNLACPASPIHYQNNPVKTMKTSVLGSINMLDIAKKTKSRILQASTSEIYGDPLEHPQKESYWGNVNTIGFRSCYDEGKRSAETLFFDYHRQYQVNIVIARIFNTYGPRMSFDDGRVVSNFIIQALRSADITIYGDGMQTRSFCYVNDLVYGLIKLMESKLPGPINLGNPNEFTILELAKIILELTNSKSRIIFKKLPKDDPKIRKPDISKARREISFEPKIELYEGLKLTIEDFKNRL